jgi:tetratricopeptide (TPR) repeat protein
VELRIVLAGILFQRYQVEEAGALYDEAIALARESFLARLRRGEFLARLGRYQDALADLSLALRLQAPDFAATLHCQQLQRWVASKASGGFIRNTGPPPIPAWLKRLGARLRTSPATH